MRLFLWNLATRHKAERSFMKIGIIGGGKVGCTLAHHLSHHLVGIVGSSSEKTAALATRFKVPTLTHELLSAKADVVLLTVPDRLVAAVAQDLAQQEPAMRNSIYLHCSGSLDLSPLASLQKIGASVGSLHPLQSFASDHEPFTPLEGVFMAVDGDSEALAAAKELVALLNGRSFHVPAKDRALYHTAACICANYTVTLQALAQDLMSRWTDNAQDAYDALRPLFEGVAANLKTATTPGEALTGPIARGDIATVERHLEVLPPAMRPLYKSLGSATTCVALANETITPLMADELFSLFESTEFLNNQSNFEATTDEETSHE